MANTRFLCQGFESPFFQYDRIMKRESIRVFVRTTLELALLCFIAMALDRYRLTLNVQHIDGFIFQVYQHLRYISDFVLDIEALHFLQVVPVLFILLRFFGDQRLLEMFKDSVKDRVRSNMRLVTCTYLINLFGSLLIKFAFYLFILVYILDEISKRNS